MNIWKGARKLGHRHTLLARVVLLGAIFTLFAGYGGQYSNGGGALAAVTICKKMDKGVAKRLTISERNLLDPDTGCPVILRGVNLRDNLRDQGGSQDTDIPLVTKAEAEDMVKLGFNFVRLRISREGANLYTGNQKNDSGLTKKTEDAIKNAVGVLKAKKIWVLLEMRTDDNTANNKLLYDTNEDTFKQYRKTWTWLATTFRKTDYIAGYGLLAEPSPDKAPEWPDISKITVCTDAKLTYPVCALIGFQSALMEEISKQDTWTPFFVGPAYNYSTLGYRWDAYAKDKRLELYSKRLIYEVNMLSPKYWITSGKIPAGSCAQSWPSSPPGLASTCPAPNFPSLVTLNFVGGESCDANLNVPRSDPPEVCKQAEAIFKENTNIEEDPKPKGGGDPVGNFYMLMDAAYPNWYLGFASQFAKRNKVPMVVDQFGATTLVDPTPQANGQQQQYEQKIIDVAESEEFKMGWARWVYKAKEPGGPVDGRDVAGNEFVHKFYFDFACKHKTNDPKLCAK